MPKIIDLTTLHCEKGTSDKLYGIVVVDYEDNTYRLITMYGSRTGTRPLSVDTRYLPRAAAFVAASKLQQSKQAGGYHPVDWRSSSYSKYHERIADIDKAYYGTQMGTAIAQSIITSKSGVWIDQNYAKDGLHAAAHKQPPASDPSKPKPAHKDAPSTTRSASNPRSLDI